MKPNTDFEEQLNKALSQSENKRDSSPKNSENIAKSLENQHIAIKLMGDIIGGLIVMGLFGFILDRIFGTHPLFLAIMTPMGVFLSLYNILRYNSLNSSKKEKSKKNIDEP